MKVYYTMLHEKEIKNKDSLLQNPKQNLFVIFNSDHEIL